MMRKTLFLSLLGILLAGPLSAVAQNAPIMQPAGRDPGPRSEPSATGGLLPGLSQLERDFALAGNTQFSNPWSVSGTIAGEPIPGLGPRYDANACAQCHSYPTIGGSSANPNNEVLMATLDGAKNTVPSFVHLNGPTVIPYCKKVVAPDCPSVGKLLEIYTITGRPDAVGCTLAQPNFAALVAADALSFHIPVPLFGVGLVDATPSSNFIAAQGKALMASLGITSDRFNHSASGISTIGWKGSASSVEFFANLAIMVELSATGKIFPRKPDEVPGCTFNGLPEDRPQLTRRTPNTPSPAADYMDVATLAGSFAKYLAPPAPVSSYNSPVVGPVSSASIANGQAKFVAAGCAACHTQHQTTGKSSMTGQSNVTYTPWSDYALHNMGSKLADGLTQGEAGPQDFRTSALWGAGQRLFFLHDGRSKDLNDATQQHYSLGSEANQTVTNFNALSTSDQQDILNFLRSL
jgi:CxxC motif-containing protein (DUF1111 family)